ncbi:MAG: aminomethyl-transferring glycine dehydrogenase subunit GcvPA [Sulfolobales archaeon]
MYHPWIPNSDPEIKKSMLEYIGKSFEDLVSDIPEEVRLRRPLKVGFGRPLSENEIEILIDKILSKNKVFIDPPSFLGGGVCMHAIPYVVRYLLLRGEIYTAYTPYQAEINQGLMQALFEYQSMLAELYGVDIVNASMYDVSTAVAEAFRMAMRVSKRRGVLVPRIMNPFIENVVRTWIEPVGGFIIRYEITESNNIRIIDSVSEKEVGGIYLENPSFLGEVIEKPEIIGEYARDKKMLFIVNAEPLSLGILKPPGEYGADIIVGNGASLGVGLNYGGPSLGILGIRMDQELLRQLPGRLIGFTREADGSGKGFAMILQTREQHIRRERATSNITTNSALEAFAAAVYLSYIGDKGLRRLGESILRRTAYLRERIESDLRDRAEIASKARLFFREIPVRFLRRDYREISRELIERGIHGGFYIGDLISGIGNTALFCVTEIHSRDHIDLLIRSLREVA